MNWFCIAWVVAIHVCMTNGNSYSMFTLQIWSHLPIGLHHRVILKQLLLAFGAVDTNVPVWESGQRGMAESEMTNKYRATWYC